MTATEVAGYHFDTNILLRLTRRGDSTRALIRHAIRELLRRDAGLYFCPQNIAELWSVLTRPVDRNGFGLSLAETEKEVRLIERKLTLLPDNETTWRRLVNDYSVRGRRVHDARLVAAMRVHGLANQLTLNRGDFVRYGGVTVIDPGELGPPG